MSGGRRFEKVLVPLDGTPFAEEALPVALAMAERLEGCLRLVSVVPYRPPLEVSGPRESEEAYVKAWVTERSKRAETYLQEVEGRIRDGGYAGDLETEVLAGGPVEVLDQQARRWGADLVVMTTQARRPVARAWLGSVADGLVRRGPCPILLWRPEREDAPDLAARPDVQRILVPLDGSERSASVTPYAQAMAGAFGAGLSVVGVIPPDEPQVTAYPALAPLEYDREIAQEAENLRERLGEAARAMEREGGGAVSVELVEDRDPATGILQHRERLGADMVALSTRGHGGVARMLLGSVADKVIRGGQVPVLVHRPTLDGNER